MSIDKIVTDAVNGAWRAVPVETETAFDIYQATDRRMSGKYRDGERDILRLRWPTLADAIAAQAIAFNDLTDLQRADDLAEIDYELGMAAANATLSDLGLI